MDARTAKNKSGVSPETVVVTPEQQAHYTALSKRSIDGPPFTEEERRQFIELQKLMDDRTAQNKT